MKSFHAEASVARLLACACFPVLASACPEPVFDADLGVEGVPVESGALAGSFALLAQATDASTLPGLDDEVGGGVTFYLVERTWDGSEYAQTLRVCAVINNVVGGLTTLVTQETALSIPPMIGTARISDATGAVEAIDYMELWAVDGVDADDPLPETPDDPAVIDMEGDGNPGATLFASGFAEGEIYVVNRKVITLGGVIRGPDESFGLVTHKKDGFVLEATNSLLDVDAARTPHPDPKESWWHEVRVAPAGEAASCDDVQRALVDRTLTRLRPFT